jgi:hypothetical protein
MFEGTVENRVTSLTLVNNTAKEVLFTVPAGERWMLISAKYTNPDDVNRAVTLELHKEAAKTNYIKKYQSGTVNAGAIQQYPSGALANTTQNQSAIPYELLGAGNTLRLYFAAGGASAGGTDADGIVITVLKKAARGAE